MDKKIVFGVVGFILVVVFGVFLLNQSAEAPTPPASETTSQATTESSDSTSSPPSGQTASITYTENGYSPATLTVKSGTIVTIKNESSSAMQFDSDPHPQHTNNEELNVDSVEPGKSQTFVADTKGTYGYHNHLNASQTGTIIVN